MKPETLARTSTLATAVKRPVYSSHSVTVFCSGRATVTGGGGGAELAAGLPSQPASNWAMSSIEPRTVARVIEFSSLTSRIGAAPPACDNNQAPRRCSVKY